jgi:hypothetical protein
LEWAKEQPGTTPFDLFNAYDSIYTKLEGQKPDSDAQILHKLVNSTVGIDSMQTKRVSEVYQAEN